MSTIFKYRYMHELLHFRIFVIYHIGNKQFYICTGQNHSSNRAIGHVYLYIRICYVYTYTVCVFPTVQYACGITKTRFKKLNVYNICVGFAFIFIGTYFYFISQMFSFE